MSAEMEAPNRSAIPGIYKRNPERLEASRATPPSLQHLACARLLRSVGAYGRGVAKFASRVWQVCGMSPPTFNCMSVARGCAGRKCRVPFGTASQLCDGHAAQSPSLQQMQFAILGQRHRVCREEGHFRGVHSLVMWAEMRTPGTNKRPRREVQHPHRH